MSVNNLERGTKAISRAAEHRRALGLRYVDEAQVSEGLTLMAASWGGNTVRLIDEAGSEVHRWELPWAPGLGQTITARGTLFACGKIIDDHPFLGGLPFQGGAVAEFDWDGKMLWEVRHSGHHHDATELANGNILLLGITQVPDLLAAQVRGGVDDMGSDGSMWADTLVEVTKSGETVWEWNSCEKLDPTLDEIGPGAMDRSEWTHGNGVVELPGGDILLSARQISTVLRISRRSGEIVQRYGVGELAGQHSPWLTESGSFLVFDNGFNRMDGAPPYSRLIEFDLESGEIVWSYIDPVPWESFSALQSSAQRLDNGNTFACEGLTARVYEVTATGELVWEYINPFFVEAASGATGQRSNRMFRAHKFSREVFGHAGINLPHPFRKDFTL